MSIVFQTTPAELDAIASDTIEAAIADIMARLRIETLQDFWGNGEAIQGALLLCRVYNGTANIKVERHPIGPDRSMVDVFSITTATVAPESTGGSKAVFYPYEHELHG